MERIPIGVVGLRFGGALLRREIAAGPGSRYFRPVAVCDRDRPLADRIAAAYRVRVYHDLADLCADSDIPVVGLFTNPNGRAALVGRIVRAGKVVTAAGVSAGLDLALAIVEEICGRERAEIIQLLIEYDPKPHLQSGHPTLASKTVLEKARREMLAAARNPRDVISIPKVLWRGVQANVRRKLGMAS